MRRFDVFNSRLACDESHESKVALYLTISLLLVLEEVKSFAFIKVPKTGSSTMYTILSRFSLDRKLDIITPDRPVYLALDSPKAKGKSMVNKFFIIKEIA